jgi:hypothetical protein
MQEVGEEKDQKAERRVDGPERETDSSGQNHFKTFSFFFIDDLWTLLRLIYT